MEEVGRSCGYHRQWQYNLKCIIFWCNYRIYMRLGTFYSKNKSIFKSKKEKKVGEGGLKWSFFFLNFIFNSDINVYVCAENVFRFRKRLYHVTPLPNPLLPISLLFDQSLIISEIHWSKQTNYYISILAAAATTEMNYFPF